MNQEDRDLKLAEIAVNIDYFRQHIPQMLQDVANLSSKLHGNETLLNKVEEDVKSLLVKFEGNVGTISKIQTDLDHINERIHELDKDLNDLWESQSDVKGTIAELKTYHAPHIHKEGKSLIERIKEIQFFAGIGAGIVAIMWAIFKIYAHIGTHIPGLPGM